MGRIHWCEILASWNPGKQREAKEYLKNFIIGIILIFLLGAGGIALISFLGNWVQVYIPPQ
jgi:hypothetical protein